MPNSVQVVGKQILFDGKEVLILGRLSGKFLPYLNHGGMNRCLEWIEFNQKLGFNLLKIHGEGMEPQGMYTQSPRYKPWPRQQMLNGNRVEDRQVDKAMLRTVHRLSHETGIAFEFTIDCTMKYISGLSSGMIGHVVSRTIDASRFCREEYPKAKIIFNLHDGFNIGVVKIEKLKQQSKRVRRWRLKGNWNQTKYSFTSPGPRWKMEQDAAAVIMVSEWAKDVSYAVGDGWDEYPIAAVKVEKPSLTVVKRLRRFNKPVWIDGSAAEVTPTDVETAVMLHTHLIVEDRKGALMENAPLTELEKFLDVSEPSQPPTWETLHEWDWGDEKYRLQREIK